MRILIYLGHPAQYHFHKFIVNSLKELGHSILYLIRTKDVLEELLLRDNQEYLNILPEGRKSNKIGILNGLIKREIRLIPIVKKFKPNLMIGSDASIAHVGKLFGIPVLTFVEDDYYVIPFLAKSTFPFSTYIIAPEICDCGKWTYKKISYNGYMKLSYLHPKHFIPKDSNDGKYILIRLSKLDAHHDKGIKGINETILHKIINYVENRKLTFKIISEKPLDNEFKKFILNSDPSNIHNALYNSQLLISDSQSMTIESAILGIPSIRISSFVGKINVLEELEHKYNLTFGVKPENIDELFVKMEFLLSMNNLKENFKYKRDLMLKDKINVKDFLVWLINEFPNSIRELQREPTIQYNFK